MKKHTIESVTIALGFLLFAGVSAPAATYTEGFATGNHGDPAENYGFTQVGNGSGNHVRAGMQIDPFGLALFGGGAWAKWNMVAIDTGVTADPGEITVYSCDASVCPPADGEDGNGATSHWGSWGVRDTIDWDATVRWRVNDPNEAEAIGGTAGWYFDPSLVNPDASEEYVPGFMGTWDAQNGKQEKIVELRVYIDRVNDVVWGSISDGSSTHTTAKVPIIENESGIGTILTGGLTANTGWQTAEGIDIDNIKAFALNLPLEISRSGIGDTPGVQFQSESNATYRLQYAIPPDSSTWFETGAKIAGDGSMMTLFDPTGPSTTRVYRVMLDL